MNQRRSFLARLGAAAAAFGTFGSAAHAQEAPPKAGGNTRWQPARDPRDDWYDQAPGKYRIFFDILSPQGVNESFRFVDNYFSASKSAYGLESGEVAVIVCLRHSATTLGYGDAFWGKYGAQLSESLKLTDPKTKEAPTTNIYRERLEANAKRGVRYAVCETASRGFAGGLARRANLSVDEVVKEMSASFIAGARWVPAGILAVDHAQTRGYSLAYVG